MLAGCPLTLPSPGIDASVQLQPYHFQLEEKKHCPPQKTMGTQRLDLPCGFSSRKDPLRAALSGETPSAEAPGTSCSFRQHPVTHSSSSSLVAQAAAPWGRTVEAIDGRNGRPWEQRRSSKRLHDRISCGDYRAKRTRTVDVEADAWPSPSTEEPPLVEAEEERVFLVPNAASFPLPAFSGHDRSRSESSSSSGAFIGSGNTATSDGPRLPPASGFVGFGGEGEGIQTEQQGHELVSLLTSCTESMSSSNYEAMSFFLARLGEMATPFGTPLHRVVAYFTEALALRAAKLLPHIFSVAPPKTITDPTDDDDDAIALLLLDCVSPIPKFLHFTLNERLLKAFEGKDRVHIIDFDVKQGLQWPALFQSLASRPNPPGHVRITGIGECGPHLQQAGVRLAGIAESLDLPFEFHPVVDRLEDIRLWMLHVKREECVAVNCALTMHKTLYDESGKALTDLLGLIRSTRPEIVVMAEQEAKHNEPTWETRLAGSLNYYASVFDSMEHALPVDSQARIKIEEAFAKEIRNIVAREGSERTERHESFDRWRKLMQDGGFRCLGIGEGEQSRMIPRMYSCENYSIHEQGEGDGLTLKWLHQPLYTVSAWAPADVTDGPSTSQPN
ncbi:protein DWARF AND LOW-TILLERING-like [Musa acuminata AAA Group]|uniref:protein DWARF AND LOW-TILLERING-like n=1 Tax=Musa acuminata AAA Group TaxID=214697 RepID=UPI0031DAF149